VVKWNRMDYNTEERLKIQQKERLEVIKLYY